MPKNINENIVNTDLIVNQIKEFLESLKCNDLSTFKILNPSYPFEYVFIATSLSERHVRSCASDLIEFVKKTPYINDFNNNILVNQKPFNFYNKSQSIISVDSTGGMDWISVEIKNIGCIAHFFTESCRKKYNLDEHIEYVNSLVS
jgi:ribosomal silencing factor RsfS